MFEYRLPIKYIYSVNQQKEKILGGMSFKLFVFKTNQKEMW